MPSNRPLFTILLFFAVATPTAAAQDRPRRILFVGQSKGYQHDAITTAMVMFYDLGTQSEEWETVFRTDCRNITKKPLPWETKNLNDFDAIAFYTDGNLDLDDSQKADLLEFIRDDGKGFIGIHSAAVTNEAWPEYRKMLGGFFDGHPWGQFRAPLLVTDPDFPGMKHLPSRFTMLDEVYQIKDFDRKQVRLLMTLDRKQIDLHRQGVHAEGNEFPLMWAREYGKGRVLYNSLGHRHEVWERSDMQSMWLDQIRWILGLPNDAQPAGP
jgi:type 1 glutamine amidotransferase